jgi:hypothetical protein
MWAVRAARARAVRTLPAARGETVERGGSPASADSGRWGRRNRRDGRRRERVSLPRHAGPHRHQRRVRRSRSRRVGRFRGRGPASGLNARPSSVSVTVLTALRGSLSQALSRRRLLPRSAVAPRNGRPLSRAFWLNSSDDWSGLTREARTSAVPPRSNRSNRSGHAATSAATAPAARAAALRSDHHLGRARRTSRNDVGDRIRVVLRVDSVAAVRAALTTARSLRQAVRPRLEQGE